MIGANWPIMPLSMPNALKALFRSSVSLTLPSNPSSSAFCPTRPEQTAQAIEPADGAVPGDLIQARHTFAQLGELRLAESVLRQPQHRTGTADGLFRRDLEFRSQRVEQPGGFRRGGTTPSPCSPWLPCMADTTLAASLRLNCAKAGLAASVNRQDRAKPRETFILEILLSMKKPPMKSGVKRALDWRGRRLFLHVLHKWPIAITENLSRPSETSDSRKTALFI